MNVLHLHDADLYDTDFYAWTRQQASLIQQKKFAQLDVAHLYEEIEDMGNRHADEIESRLAVLLMHLLKWQYQPNLQSRSWQLTIKEQRLRIKRCLKKMPSLKTKLPELLIDAYESAVLMAEQETGLAEAVFPKHCSWNIDQILDDKYLGD